MSEPTLGDRIMARRALMNSAAADAAATVAETKATEVATTVAQTHADAVVSAVGDAVKTYVDDQIAQLAATNDLVVPTPPDPAPVLTDQIQQALTTPSDSGPALA